MDKLAWLWPTIHSVSPSCLAETGLWGDLNWLCGWSHENSQFMIKSINSPIDPINYNLHDNIISLDIWNIGWTHDKPIRKRLCIWICHHVCCCGLPWFSDDWLMMFDPLWNYWPVINQFRKKSHNIYFIRCQSCLSCCHWNQGITMHCVEGIEVIVCMNRYRGSMACCRLLSWYPIM